MGFSATITDQYPPGKSWVPPCRSPATGTQFLFGRNPATTSQARYWSRAEGQSGFSLGPDNRTFVGVIESWNIGVDGNLAYMTSQGFSDSGETVVVFASFDLDTSLWIGNVATIGPQVNDLSSSTIVRRNDGSYLIAFQNGTNRVMGTNYYIVALACSSDGGVNWSIISQVLTNQSEFHTIGPQLVYDPVSGRTYLMTASADNASSNLWINVIEPDGDSVTPPTVNPGTDTGLQTLLINNPIGRGVCRGGQVRVPFVDPSNVLYVLDFNAVAAPVTFGTSQLGAVHSESDSVAAGLAREGGKLHACYTTLSGRNVVRQDDNGADDWQPPILSFTATAGPVSCAVYPDFDDNNLVLAQTFDDAGVYTYHEDVIATGPPMMCYLQDTKDPAEPERQIDAWSWLNEPRRPEPVGGEVLDDQPGWPCAMNAMGCLFGGYDHYCIEAINDPTHPDPLNQHGARVTVWVDDLEDLGGTTYDEYGRQITIYPPAPDPAFGDAWNTRITSRTWAGPLSSAYLSSDGRPVPEPWTEFPYPPADLTGHGIWAPNFDEHEAARTGPHMWREWIAHVPDEFVKDGRIAPQRTLGRFSIPEHTITYFQRDTARPTGAHAASNELALELAPGTGQTAAETIGSGSDELAFVFTTPANQPGSAAWPDGVYRCQLDVGQVGTDVDFGFLPLAGSAGHFGRVNAGLTADLETKVQAESVFLGSDGPGLKLATTGNVSWAAGSPGDRFECLLACIRSLNHGNQRLDLTFDADAFVDGPWSSGVEVTPAPAAVRGSTVNPAVLITTPPIVPAPASAVGHAGAPVVVLGSLTLAGLVAGAIGRAAGPAVVLGPLALMPGAASAIGRTVDPNVMIGSLPITPAPAIAIGRAGAPSVVEGSVLIVPGSASASGQGGAPAVRLGSLLLAPGPAAARGRSAGPQVEQGSLALQPAPAGAAGAAGPPVVSLGSLSLATAAASAVGRAAGPVVSEGGLIVLPAPAGALGRVAAPGVQLGSVAIAPAAAAAIARTIDPNVLITGGGVVVSPVPASALGRAVAPDPVSGSLILTPAAASAVARTVAPGVALSSLVVLPGSSVAVGAVRAPAVIVRSMMQPGDATLIVAADSAELLERAAEASPGAGGAGAQLTDAADSSTQSDAGSEAKLDGKP